VTTVTYTTSVILLQTILIQRNVERTSVVACHTYYYTTMRGSETCSGCKSRLIVGVIRNIERSIKRNVDVLERPQQKRRNVLKKTTISTNKQNNYLNVDSIYCPHCMVMLHFHSNIISTPYQTVVCEE
jgi:hypothetical protein